MCLLQPQMVKILSPSGTSTLTRTGLSWVQGLSLSRARKKQIWWDALRELCDTLCPGGRWAFTAEHGAADQIRQEECSLLCQVILLEGKEHSIHLP